MYHLIETGQLELDLSAVSPRSRVGLPAKLEPFKPLIQERLAAFPIACTPLPPRSILTRQERSARRSGGALGLVLTPRSRNGRTRCAVVCGGAAQGFDASHQFAACQAHNKRMT